MGRRKLSSVMLTVQDVMDLLGVSRWTVNRLIKRGELRACRIGRLVRVHRDDFAMFLERVRQIDRAKMAE